MRDAVGQPWRMALRPEDGILAAWLAAGAPVATFLGGPEVGESAIAGLVIIGSVIAAIVRLGMRPPDQPRVGLGETSFYAMLVVAPRQLVDPEDAGVRWLLRFVVFLVASLTGIGWLTRIG